jgi:hypothetical protein
MGEKVIKFIYESRYTTVDETFFFLKLLLPASGLTMFSWAHHMESTFVFFLVAILQRLIKGLIAYSSSNNANILEETDDKFTFPVGALLSGKDNVITVLQVVF